MLKILTPKKININIEKSFFNHKGNNVKNSDVLIQKLEFFPIEMCGFYHAQKNSKYVKINSDY